MEVNLYFPLWLGMFGKSTSELHVVPVHINRPTIILESALINICWTLFGAENALKMKEPAQKYCLVTYKCFVTVVPQK